MGASQPLRPTCTASAAVGDLVGREPHSIWSQELRWGFCYLTIVDLLVILFTPTLCGDCGL